MDSAANRVGAQRHQLGVAGAAVGRNGHLCADRPELELKVSAKLLAGRGDDDGAGDI